MRFLFGLGQYLHPSDKSHRVLARVAVESGVGFHFCFDYPGAARFVRKTTSRSERGESAFMARVPCFDINLLRREVDRTLRDLDIENIETLQLWGGNEVFDSWDQESELHMALCSLREQGKIRTFVPQLYFDQTSAIPTERKHHSFAFYGSALGLHVDSELVGQLEHGKSIAMAAFGGLAGKTAPKFVSIEEREIWLGLQSRLGWNGFCLAALSCFDFIETAVGSTARIERLATIVDYLQAPPAPSRSEQEAITCVAIRSYQGGHSSVKNPRLRWLEDSRKLRSKTMKAKQFAYYQAGRWAPAKKIVDIFLGR